MAQATLSTKYQLVIPREIRESLKLTPGQTVQVLSKGGVITLVPVRPVTALRGFVRGMKTGGLREKKDRI